jgi:hypothetical protein
LLGQEHGGRRPIGPRPTEGAASAGQVLAACVHRAYVRLANFKLTDPSPWQPEAIRIHIDDLDCASASPWPVGVRRPDGDAKISDLIGHYCLVPGDQAAELHAFARGESRPGPSQPKGRGPFNAFDVYPAEEYLDEVVEALRRAAR